MFMYTGGSIVVSLICLAISQDPVLSFGTVSQHVHKISGASNININSTYDSLQEAACTSCEIQKG
jgi:hypothetical protein